MSAIQAYSPVKPTLETLPLTENERQFLWWKWKDKRNYIWTTYSLLSLGLSIVWLFPYFTSGLSFGELFRFRRFWVTIVFLVFAVCLLTIFFYRYYRKEALPFYRDLQEGNKQVHWFIPGKYQTPFFAEYFIRTPLEKCKLIKISGADYQEIHPQTVVGISIAPLSGLILKAEKENGSEMNIISWTP